MSIRRRMNNDYIILAQITYIISYIYIYNILIKLYNMSIRGNSSTFLTILIHIYSYTNIK